MAKNRDEFTEKTKERLRSRVNGLCSKPDCNISCVAPKENDPEGLKVVGVAAHICAATEGGPRFDKNMTQQERKSISNGIWLCQIHAKEIDIIDRGKYKITKEDLLLWKNKAEQRSSEELGEKQSLVKNQPFVVDDSEKALFVKTKSFHNSIEKISKLHTVIITGEPGIGKTTLAKNLCLHFQSKGYEVIVLKKKSIDEVNSQFSDSKKLIFYFDDFLGSNFLEAITNNEDSEISKFIQKVRRSENNIFVLTSRTNIFNRGMLISDTFKSHNLEYNEYTICTDDITNYERAKILYNHIYKRKLSPELSNVYIKNEFYFEVIQHRNFNPRIIEFITDYRRIENCPDQTYTDFILKSLNNPEIIWEQTYQQQSDKATKILVGLVVFNGGNIHENHLKYAYKNYILRCSSNEDDFVFNYRIKELLKYFLIRNMDTNGDISYRLFNPSITDFLLNHIGFDPECISKYFISLKGERSINFLASLQKKISKNDLSRILLNAINTELDTTDASYYYLLDLAYLYLKINKSVPKKTKKIIYNYLKSPNSYQMQDKYIELLLQYIEQHGMPKSSFNPIKNINFFIAGIHVSNIIKLLEIYQPDEQDKELIYSDILRALRDDLEDDILNNVDFSDSILYEDEIDKKVARELISDYCFTLINDLPYIEGITPMYDDLFNDLEFEDIYNNIIAYTLNNPYEEPKEKKLNDDLLTENNKIRDLFEQKKPNE